MLQCKDQYSPGQELNLIYSGKFGRPGAQAAVSPKPTSSPSRIGGMAMRKAETGFTL